MTDYHYIKRVLDDYLKRGTTIEFDDNVYSYMREHLDRLLYTALGYEVRLEKFSGVDEIEDFVSVIDRQWGVDSLYQRSHEKPDVLDNYDEYYDEYNIENSLLGLGEYKEYHKNVARLILIAFGHPFRISPYRRLYNYYAKAKDEGEIVFADFPKYLGVYAGNEYTLHTFRKANMGDFLGVGDKAAPNTNTNVNVDIYENAPLNAHIIYGLSCMYEMLAGEMEPETKEVKLEPDPKPWLLCGLTEDGFNKLMPEYLMCDRVEKKETGDESAKKRFEEDYEFLCEHYKYPQKKVAKDVRENMSPEVQALFIESYKKVQEYIESQLEIENPRARRLSLDFKTFVDVYLAKTNQNYLHPNAELRHRIMAYIERYTRAMEG